MAAFTPVARPEEAGVSWLGVSSASGVGSRGALLGVEEGASREEDLRSVEVTRVQACGSEGV